jgi:circadian clock protein KaiB
MTEKYILKLYVTGETANSRTVIKNLNDILEREPKDLYTLDVIDVLENPQAAEEDKILATPTLIKVFPEPAKRIIGDLSDRGKVKSGLGLADEPKQSVNSDENFGVTL